MTEILEHFESLEENLYVSKDEKYFRRYLIFIRKKNDTK